MANSDWTLPLLNTDYWQNREAIVSRLANEHDLPAAKNPRTVAAANADLAAGVASYAAAGSLVALREGFIATAQRKTSVHVAAKSLGTRLVRNTPARVEIQLSRTTRDAQLTINPMTQFLVDGMSFFNRTPINFAQGETTVGGRYSGVFLYAGSLHTASATLSANDNFETLELPPSNFMVSDTDVIVLVNGTMWQRTDKAVFLYGPNDPVFMDDTSYDGKCQITFGNNLHGLRPASTDDIELWYAKCGGAADNNPAVGLQVVVPAHPTVTGQTETAVENGQNPPHFSQYKFSAPLLARIGSLDKSASSRSEHEAFLNDFPNVADMQVLGQEDLIKLDPVKYAHPGYMNHLELIVLPLRGDSSSLSPADRQSMCDYLLTKSKVAREVAMNYVSEGVPVNVYIELFIPADVVPDAATAAAEAAVRNVFARKMGLLRRPLLLSDLTDPIKAKVPKLDYATVLQPTAPLTDLKPYQYPVLQALDIRVYYSNRRAKG